MSRSAGDEIVARLRNRYHDSAILRTVLALPVRLRRQLLQRKNRQMTEIIGRLGSLIETDPILRVDEFEGRFRCSPRSHLFNRIIIDGFYEPETKRLFLKHIDPERDVIDVGANIGFFSVLASRKLARGRVLAIEPTDAAHAKLIENLELNGVRDKVTVFKGLASDSAGQAQIHHIAGMEEFSAMGGIVHETVRDLDRTSSLEQTRTVDDLVEEYGLDPALIKVDVEGAEGLVFAGARKTLETSRPVVISELARPMLETMGSSPEAVIAAFHALDYEVTDPSNRSARPGQMPYGEILCLPR